MKACQNCQTTNQDSSRFCKKCGTPFSSATYRDKKKALDQGKGRFPWLTCSLIILAVVLGGFAYWLVQSNTGERSWFSTEMTDVTAKVENGKISIPLGIVKQKKLVRFEYANNGVRVPLLSYLSPAGRVMTAVSMCEPCRSTRFHIQGKKIICNACYSEWDLETLKGIKGECLPYPPDILSSKVVNGQIEIEEKLASQWKPRI
jgi:uncharacterized membrane protein